MGDSDDDGDYKRRDKFRTERDGYGDGGGAPRREWRDDRGPGGMPPSGGGGTGAGWGGRGDRRDVGPHRAYPPRRERYDDRSMSPPPKRMREWDDRYDGRGPGRYEGGYQDRYERPHDMYNSGGGYPARGRGGGYFPRGGHNGPMHHDRHSEGGRGAENADGTQPAMMSFKTFLGTQDDTISDEEAIKKYAEYKLEFKRQQLNEFFVNHKDEEWFKLKYHPEDSSKRKEEQKTALNCRVEVFNKFLKQGKFDKVTVDNDQSDSIVKLLDSVVILLEGGNDFDLQVLEQTDDDEKEKSVDKEDKPFVLGDDDKKEDTKTENNSSEEGKPLDLPISKEQMELQKKAKEYLAAKSNEDTNTTENDEEQKAEDEEKEGKKKGRKRKRTKEFDDESSEESSEDEGEDELPPGMEKTTDQEKKDSNEKETENTDITAVSGELTCDGNEEKIDVVEDGEANEKENHDKKENDSKVAEKKDEQEDSNIEEIDGMKPRPLHKVTSIFLRNLSPTITKQEVEAMCRRYPGFLRAAIADPSPERRWFRRGWVTFERDTKIKDICFNLNNIRLRECELGPIVNRDLSRRIRTVNGITVDKKVVRNDIKLAAKVITNLDTRWQLWNFGENNEKNENQEQEVKNEPASGDNESLSSIGLASNNPILANITDYLIEEASAEEEELLGKNNDLEDGEEGEEGNSVTRDDELLKVLDRLLFYLRIVHSVDYYNHSEYPNEDEMPNRCGIMHARGIPPLSNVTQTEFDEYIATFSKKMGSFLQPRQDLSHEEAMKLGMKNEADEVEKFVQANTQELGKDKWLCPLSGKKFKGPDFVRKHIFNKHAEKVEEVKKEVKYYNNYLKDPKRPQLPESNQKSAHTANGRGQRSDQPPQDPYHYGGFPREATNYPVFEDPRERDRGYNEPRYSGSGPGGGPGAYGERGGYRGRGRPDYGMRGRVRDRIGGPVHQMPPVPGVRMTQSLADPRGVIDYGDVDFSQDAEYF